MEEQRDVRKKIVDTANLLFYRHGVHAVGTNWLIEESGVAKDTFYRHFRTKEKLIIAYIEARHQAAYARFVQILGVPGKIPQQKVMDLFVELIGKVQREGFRGCAFIMLLAEYSHVPEIAKIAHDHKESLRVEIERTCALFHSEPQRISRQLFILHEGFLARSAMGRNFDDQEALLLLVKTITGASDQMHHS